MATDELDAFVSVPEAEPAPAVETPAAKPEPEPKADVAAKPDTEVAPEAEDDLPEGELIPRRAFDAMRHERTDWKSKAVAAETTAAELRRQLEEAKRAPPPAPVQQAQPAEIPSPLHDPAGYHAYIAQEQQRAQINHLLNVSEMMAVKEHGAEKVAAMKAEFLAAKEADPTLGERLIQQSDPYGWAMQQIEKIRAQREIGDDPAAYKARVIAEWQAANEQPPPRVSPAAGMAPSLASVRSVAGRSAPSWTGPTPLTDILRRN